MSASSNIRAAGLAALLITNGELLTFRQASVSGIVNRNVKAARDNISARDGRIDFSLMGVTEIEVAFGGIAQPVAGDTFIDSVGIRHRVKMVCATDISWVCYCESSQV